MKSTTIDGNAIEKQLDEDDKVPELKKIDRDFRRMILLSLAKANDDNPYLILDLKVGVSIETVRLRYHDLSRSLHPDKHYRKELGPYKRKLESLFSRIQKAYSKLKDPYSKEALDKLLKLKDTPAKTRPIQGDGSTFKASSKPKPPTQLSKEMERWGKAEAAYKKGLDFEKNGFAWDAYMHFVEAVKLEPKRDTYKAAHQRIQAAAFRERSQREIQELKNEITSSGASQAILRKSEELLRLEPESLDAKIIFSRCIVERKMEDRYHEAEVLLQRLKSARPQDSDPCLWLARLYENRGEKKAAMKEAKEALNRNPKNSSAEKLIQRLK